MFTRDKEPGRAVCLAAYGRVQKGAIVPKSNELWGDVEAWIAEGNTLAEFSGYPELPMTEEQREDWRDSAVVSRFQAFQALDDLGLLASVEQWATTKAGKEKRAFDMAQEFRYRSQTIDAACQELGIADTQRDDLFEHALTIEA